MKHPNSGARNIFLIFISILAGLCLFTAQSTLIMNKSILNSEFHKNLFNKNNIYEYAKTGIKSSISNLHCNIKNISPKMFNRYTSIFSAINTLVTPELVEYNIDNLAEEIFEYFEGQKSFLPDIYLNLNNEMRYAQNDKTPSGNNNNHVTGILGRIRKVNLNAILLYMDKTDILNFLSLFKGFYKALLLVPYLSILLFLLIFITLILIYPKSESILKYIGISVGICALLSVISGLTAYIFSLRNSFPYTFSIYILPENIVRSYIKDCIITLSVSLLSTGLILLIASFIIIRFSSLQQFRNLRINNTFSLAKNSAVIMIPILVFTIFTQNIYSSFKYEKPYDFIKTISSPGISPAKANVIQAENETIYALQLKVTDRNSGSPVENIKININGKSKNNRWYNKTGITDKSGYKFILDEGTFECTFLDNKFIKSYNIPSPFLFDLEKAGTTVITVYLDSKKTL